MNYEPFDHRHRFAVWAAARAAQRAFTSVNLLRDALEATDIVAFVRDPISLETNEGAFERHHRRWCRKIVGFLNQKGIANVTFGRAAKLVAIYLKSMIVIGPHLSSSLASVAHPPIDRILLQNLASSVAESANSSKWRMTAWTTLDEVSYYDLISELKGVLSLGEPFWKLEQYWTITNVS